MPHRHPIGRRVARHARTALCAAQEVHVSRRFGPGLSCQRGIASVYVAEISFQGRPMIDYAGARHPPRPELIDAHHHAWQQIGAPGTWLRGRDRVAIADETRAALSCALCAMRKSALSPFAISGAHSQRNDLAPGMVDLVHRLATDPGRLTRDWFDRIIGPDLTVEQYVEAVSVVATTVLIDTQHRALGVDVPSLPVAQAGEPARTVNPDCVDGGAWVPMVPADQTPSDTGLPAAPNILRAMSAVPGAVALFFGAFRPHYALKNLRLAISQAQAEFVAARVSALNECFY